MGQLVGDVDRFAREVWGRRPELLGRDTSASSAVSLTLDDVDQILTSAVRPPGVRVVRDGTRVPPHRYCRPVRIGATTVSDVVSPERLLDEFRRGATIVLQSLHRTWAPMSAWCADLEAELGWPVQCNAYLSPPGTGGLDRHADGHDVFVVQTYGSKQWYVDGLGAVTLRAGDGLYLPADVEHEAWTTGHEPSLHVTIGVHRPRPERFARAALDRIEIATDPAPLGRDAPLGEAVSHAVQQAAGALGDADPDAVGAAVRRRPRRHLGGLVSASVRRDPVDDDTRLTLVPGCDLQVEQVGERLRCTWHDGTLWMPAHTEAAMRMIATTDGGRGGQLRLRDLPELNVEGRAVLARRLADEGVVELD